VPYRAKKCVVDDWPRLRVDRNNLNEHFPPRKKQNIGVLNGEPSGHRQDADLDAAEARLLAPRFLPPTGWIFGHCPSAPSSHRLFKTDRSLDTAFLAYCDTDGKKLLELRSTGTQTVVPPSIHEETGEPVRWEQRDGIGEVPLADLEEAVGALAAAVILSRHWPQRGSRDDAAMALAGGLTSAGWSDEEADAFTQ